MKLIFLFAFLTASIAKADIKAILFDVFGTLVEVDGSLVASGEKWSQHSGVSVDWNGLVNDWILNHATEVGAITTRQRPWRTINEIHRAALPALLRRHLKTTHHFSVTELNDINRFWEELEPWPDVITALSDLKIRYTIAPLSNADFELMENLSRNRLPWSLIFSAESVKTYKPAESVYRFAQESLSLKSTEIMLVASHAYDLRAAKKLGWKTAYVFRDENTSEIRPRPETNEFTYYIRDLRELARKIAAL